MNLVTFGGGGDGGGRGGGMVHLKQTPTKP